MKAWKRIEPTVVSKIGWRTIVSKTFEMPDGQIQAYGTNGGEETHVGAVLALTPDNQVIIARQFRPGPEKIFDELPGGGIEAGEDPTVGLARELREETGYQPGKMTLLGTTQKDAYTNTVWHYYLATDCTPHPDGYEHEDTEHIEILLISIEQLIKNARAGRMSDLEAVFFAYDELQRRLQK